MPEPVSLPPLVPWPGAAIGFCGKLPARGDFVASALPRRFVEPWHDWVQRMLAASRDRLGDGWLAAWLEAPIWRFALSPGVCGPDAAIGLWLPSVDRVGRYFPLTVAAVTADVEFAMLLETGGGFLAAAESAGLDALACDLAPEVLAAAVATAAATGAADCGIGSEGRPAGGALWWSDGCDRVPAGIVATRSLPDEEMFTGMLDAGIAVWPVVCGEA